MAILLQFSSGDVAAQTRAEVPRPVLSTPDNQDLFERDRSNFKLYNEARRKKVLAIEKENNPTVDVRADNLEFLRDPQRAQGTGGVVVSRAGVSVQSDDAFVNTETKDSDLKGNLLIAGMDAEIGGERGEFNLESETGIFHNAAVAMDQGGFNFWGERINKISEFSYELFDARLTTCGCTDGDSSWHIDAASSEVTQEGYAHAYHATFKMYDVPFFYTPYIAFPVKTERASGILTPSFGISRQDGVQFSLPIFGVIDDSTDVMLTPFVATQSRVGTTADFRKVFSNYNRVNTHWVYSDESKRGDNLRGVDVSAFDQSKSLIDTNRFGGVYQQTWRGESDDIIPWGMNSDLRYVSDDLLLRELQDSQIGPQLSRFSTSRASLSGAFGDYVSASVGGEYNQSLIDPDQGVLQRLPIVSTAAQRSFRPFGFNPYGVKLNSQVLVNSVDFHREQGFDGWRHDINPSIGIPFHYLNYFDSELSVSTHQTYYQMNSSFDPRTSAEADFNTQRSVHQFSYTTRTALERVYDLDPGNALTYLTSMGSESQVFRLERVKHTIEPFLNYTYIPQEDQRFNPIYDSLDRIGTRSLFTYGFRTALQGRFLPPGGVAKTDIPELTPRVQDLPLFDNNAAGLPEFGNTRMFGNGGNFNVRNGEIRDIIYLTVRQSYDYIEDIHDYDPGRSALSALYSELGVAPTSYLGFWIKSNYDVENRDPASWDFGTSVRDDRGDVLALHYQFIGPQYDSGAMQYGSAPNLHQIEGNVEFVLTEQARLAYYARYDDIKKEVQANRFALRFSDSCKCWFFDVGFSTQTNPDRQYATVSLTLNGLGALQQKFGLNAQNANGP